MIRITSTHKDISGTADDDRMGLVVRGGQFVMVRADQMNVGDLFFRADNDDEPQGIDEMFPINRIERN
jgi:hypothetical protein